MERGKSEYPEATAVLLLCDCGGSNNARYYIFKEELQKLSDELNIASVSHIIRRTRRNTTR